MSAPNAPTLAVVNAGTGTSVTATLVGDPGVTHRLYYRRNVDSAWTAGLTCVGDGTITQTGLSSGRYFLMAVSDDAGEYSLPSPLREVDVYATATSILELVIANRLAKLGELVSTGILLGIRRPVQIGDDLPEEHLHGWLLQLACVPEPKTPLNYLTWRLHVAAAVPIRPEKGDATPIDQAINDLGARIHDKWASDPLCGNYACEQEKLLGIVPFPPNDKRVDGVIVGVEIAFRHLATNSFQR